MKQVIIILFTFGLVSCNLSSVPKSTDDNTMAFNLNTPKSIENIELSKEQLDLNQLEGVWYYNNEPFNGYSVKFHTNGSLGERLGFYNGKREGVARRWSENGVLRTEYYYDQNRLTGVYKTWWENGALSQESHYINGIKQGVEQKWFPTGQLAKLRRLVDGREEGIQQAWLDNGKLYVNYEAKNGRIFGMRRANSCYKLEDEVIIRN